MEMLKKDNDFRKKVVSFVKQMDIGITDLIVGEIAPGTLGFPKGVHIRITKKKEKMKKRYNFQIRYRNLTSVHNILNSDGHPIANVEFNADKEESEGTQKLIYLLGPIMHTLQNGRVLVIDELDARLHPLITMSIVKLFNSTNMNPNNAQLIFATHDTNLLSKDLFRRDQIWFTEKDRYNATNLYSLVENKYAMTNLMKSITFPEIWRNSVYW
jgi:uncharacterized protein